MVSVVALVCLFTTPVCSDDTYKLKFSTTFEGSAPTIESCADLVAQLYDLKTLKEDEYISFSCVNQDNV